MKGVRWPWREGDPKASPNMGCGVGSCPQVGIFLHLLYLCCNGDIVVIVGL